MAKFAIPQTWQSFSYRKIGHVGPSLCSQWVMSMLNQGSWELFTLWQTYQIFFLQMAIEIMDLPSYKMVDFSIANCKRLPNGTIWGEWITLSLKGWHMFASKCPIATSSHKPVTPCLGRVVILSQVGPKPTCNNFAHRISSMHKLNISV